MNKQDLIEAIASEADITLKDAKACLEAFTTAVTKELATGDTVQLVGFGTFKISHRAERQGRNPSTGEAITIKAQNKPTFTPGSGLKGAVN